MQACIAMRALLAPRWRPRREALRAYEVVATASLQLQAFYFACVYIYSAHSYSQSH